MSPPEFVDEAYWNPKCKNFEIMDWEKWEAKNPSPPFTFDPPQRKTAYQGFKFMPLYWWTRSCYCQPFACMLHKSCFSKKPSMGRITDKNDSVLKGLLGPNPNPGAVHPALKDSLFWTQNNNAPESLISFNRYAWRSQVKGGRVVALGILGNDFTNDATCFGFAFSLNKRYVTIQTSPDGKWIQLCTFANPNDVNEECKYLYIYVVQEGDVFKDTDGNVIEYVQPGDIMRCTWGDLLDPYECNNNNLKFSYFPRRVAKLDETTGDVVRVSPHFDDLYASATSDPGKCCETCCYTCAPCMSGPERWDFQVENVSDLQVWASAPTPPTADKIERLETKFAE
jgi:hypothetical protein